jgi:hypothetical protein
MSSNQSPVLCFSNTEVSDVKRYCLVNFVWPFVKTDDDCVDKYNILLCTFFLVFLIQNWCPYFAFFQCTQSSSVFTKGQTKFTKQYCLTSETSVFEKQRTGLWLEDACAKRWSGVLIEHMNRGVFQSPVGTIIVPSCTWSRSVPWNITHVLFTFLPTPYM